MNELIISTHELSRSRLSYEFWILSIGAGQLFINTKSDFNAPNNVGSGLNGVEIRINYE